ncbi:MAG: formate dehydrogenase accessory sulfurtransferase FdhD [Chloroflexota bacterium]
MSNSNAHIQYLQVNSEGWHSEDAEVVVETPVSLTINGEVWLSLMCTPTDLEALAVGFIYNEGLIQSLDEVASVRVCPGGENIDIWVNHSLEKPASWRRTSGCTGGVTSQDARVVGGEVVTYNGVTLSTSQAGELIGLLLDSQDLYRKSGGVHTSALSDGHSLLVVTEDIGRHNTLDKIAGRCLLENIQPARRILLTTGRVSSEMMQKAARIGAAVVISRTSPSSLSIQMAERWGITLIGYARRNSMRIYTHPERMTALSSEAEKLVEDQNVKSKSETKTS